MFEYLVAIAGSGEVVINLNRHDYKRIVSSNGTFYQGLLLDKNETFSKHDATNSSMTGPTAKKADATREMRKLALRNVRSDRSHMRNSSHSRFKYDLKCAGHWRSLCLAAPRSLICRITTATGTYWLFSPCPVFQFRLIITATGTYRLFSHCPVF